jgi:excisionase family DNA binding protein
MSTTDPADELRRLYPPILTTAHVADMMHCTIGDVRDKVHRKELPAMRWGQQFRFFRDEVIATMTPVTDEDLTDEDLEDLEEWSDETGGGEES